MKRRTPAFARSAPIHVFLNLGMFVCEATRGRRVCVSGSTFTTDHASKDNHPEEPQCEIDATW
jgi:hypothetical protein